MSNKFKSWFVISAILLVALTTIGAAGGWYGPLYQTGMGMVTATTQPQSTASPATLLGSRSIKAPSSISALLRGPQE